MECGLVIDIYCSKEILHPFQVEFFFSKTTGDIVNKLALWL